MTLDFLLLYLLCFLKTDSLDINIVNIMTVNEMIREGKRDGLVQWSCQHLFFSFQAKCQ